ncbi:discoidin domain-containing protein [Pontibacter toksunensis]|uniref:Discoidin domain-containing protein n=1 Tax=Pontibacter toksunensis TaxID=1332631 RepID=A0ABW6BPC5_9BACT
MRKKIINTEKQEYGAAIPGGLNLESLAQVEITSEDEKHPIEAAFTSDENTQWKAAEPGEQTIRILFDEPQKVRKIQLLFREEDQERMQEFLIRWLPANEKAYRDLVRQQYNFSPPHTTTEAEEYNVELEAVKALELTIIPERSGRSAYASLAQLQLS